MPEPAPIEVYKALADDTRYRLYRYLRLSGRPVSIRELSTRLSLHPNTLRPHLRRLEEAGLAASEVHRVATVGRPQVMYTAVAREEREGRDYRLLGEILAGLIGGKRQLERAEAVAREWGAYLVGRSVPRPGARGPSGLNLAVLQEALAEAGLRPPLPAAERQDRGDLPARLPVPRPAGRASGAGLRGPSGAARGHARRLAALAPPHGVRTAGRTIQRLPPGRPRRLTRTFPASPRTTSDGLRGKWN